MASRVERADAASGNLVVAQADERRVSGEAPASGTVVLPPAQLITQAAANVGLTIQPARGGNRINATVADRAREQKIQGALSGLTDEPLSAIGGARGAPATADTVRRYFFKRRDAVARSFMDNHNFTRLQAEAAADQWVARNVARWQYQRTEHRGDGLRALTQAGMLIAIANAGGDVPPHLLAAALATQNSVRQRLIDASTTPESNPDEVAAQVDAYLRTLGNSVNTSTAGWGDEMRALREAEYYRPFNPDTSGQRSEAAPFSPPQYTQRQIGGPGTATEQEHSEAMRRANRAASAEHAVRVEQRKRDDLRAHLANLEAEGRPVGGPTYG